MVVLVRISIPEGSPTHRELEKRGERIAAESSEAIWTVPFSNPTPDRIGQALSLVWGNPEVRRVVIEKVVDG